MTRISARSFAASLISLALLQVPLFAAAPAPETVGAHYMGTIGDGMAVQMLLMKKEGGISGSYFYERSGVPLFLTGKRDKSFYATLDERTSKDRKSGLFEGLLDLSGTVFNGTWSSPDGNKSLPFALEKTATYYRVQAKGRKVSAIADFPVFRKNSAPLRKISETLRAEMIDRNERFVAEMAADSKDANRADPYTLDQSATIRYESEDLISVLCFACENTGGAHGLCDYSFRNWWIRGGVASSFNLDDVFLADSGWRAKLSAACVRELKKQGASLVLDGSIKSFSSENLKTFVLSPTGLTFVFSPYSVGTWAEGTFEAAVPFKELAAQIDPRGPLGRFVR